MRQQSQNIVAWRFNNISNPVYSGVCLSRMCQYSIQDCMTTLVTRETMAGISPVQSYFDFPDTYPSHRCSSKHSMQSTRMSRNQQDSNCACTSEFASSQDTESCSKVPWLLYVFDTECPRRTCHWLVNRSSMNSRNSSEERNWFSSSMQWLRWQSRYATNVREMNTKRPGGDSYIKGRGTHRTFQGFKLQFWCPLPPVLVPLTVLNSKRSTAGVFAAPFRVLNRKKTTHDRIWCTVFELIPLTRGEKDFQPRPQNRISVPLGGSLQNLRRVTSPLLYEGLPSLVAQVLPWDGCPITKFWLTNSVLWLRLAVDLRKFNERPLMLRNTETYSEV